ncbi:MAG: hypothetical protein WA622_07360 [Mycobacterium sp.]|uniref:hypothetical protein n=1 Tax=Mycobacterium sp. TaxID=1785 RepID=UPI003BB5655F
MIPTRSQIESYTTDHLVDAADYWGSLADRWEDAHWQVRNEAHSLNWEGSAGDAMRARTVADYTVATHRADQLRAAAGIARQQAGELERLRNRILYAVGDAEDAGFAVGEDLSVNDIRATMNPAELIARQSKAHAFAADIRQRAVMLTGVDNDVAGSLTAIAGNVGDALFTGLPVE